MSADLRSLLAQAEDDLTQSIGTPGGPVTERLRTAVARRRRVRHLREAAGAFAVLAAVAGAASWAAADAGPVPPVVSPASPAPTATASPSVSPSASASATSTPLGPVVREADVDDVTVLARQAAPRTGEVWTTPVTAPEMQAVLATDGSDTVWRVGRRGAGTIYVVTLPPVLEIEGARVSGLYEVDSAGVRAVVCPSARAGDPCTDPELPPGAVRDQETFYDTMTLPRAVELEAGWDLTTTATTGTPRYPRLLLGSFGPVDEDETTTVVADLGATEVVEISGPGEVEGLSDARYAIRTPYGATLDVSADDVPGGEFSRIRWDDGVARAVPPTLPEQSSAPSSGACFAGTFSVEASHEPADWRAAGSTPGGNRVYVPVPGGNAVSRAVRAWHAQSSSALDEETGELVQGPESYRYGTDEQFLADNALYAVQGPDGEWQLRLRADAVQAVYECA